MSAQVTVHTVTTVERTSGQVCVCNVGYFQSWQGALRITRLISSLACLVAAAMIVFQLCDTRALKFSCVVSNDLAFTLAAVVIMFVAEVAWFFIYLCAANRRCPAAIKFVVISYNVIQVIIMYAAVVVISGVGSMVVGSMGVFHDYIMTYVAFGVVVIATYSLDIYFNVIWLKGGPELAALPCVVA